MSTWSHSSLIQYANGPLQIEIVAMVVCPLNLRSVHPDDTLIQGDVEAHGGGGKGVLEKQFVPLLKRISRLNPT
jgi:hypothetical protein